MKTIYFDYAATTPVDPRVAEKMMEYLTPNGKFGNSASTHFFGKEAKTAVDAAREQVAALIQAETNEIIWTSGATEANNLALKGASQLYQARGKHIVTMKTEHPSVLDCCQHLEKHGFAVTYLTPEKNGALNLEQFISSLREDTFLVSIMHVNNETGVIQNISDLANITAERNILFHVDAVQSVGKIPINLSEMSVDLMSFCAHKLYGPKGIGALYVRRRPRVRVAPQIHGGGQEQGMRSGTLPVHQIVGMGEAFQIAQNQMQMDQKNISHLRDKFLNLLPSKIMINGENTIPNILNFRTNVKAERLLAALPELAFSSGSACQSKGVEPSYILRAMGQTADEAAHGVRFSFGRFTTAKDVEIAAQLLAAKLP